MYWEEIIRETSCIFHTWKLTCGLWAVSNIPILTRKRSVKVKTHILNIQQMLVDWTLYTRRNAHIYFFFSAGHHTIYIGVRVPKSYRRRRRHRRRTGHKDRKERLMENTSDKSDTENNDEASNSILKPLSKFWWTSRQTWLEPVSVFTEGSSFFWEKKASAAPNDPSEAAESTKWPEIAAQVLLTDESVLTEQSKFSLEVIYNGMSAAVMLATAIPCLQTYSTCVCLWVWCALWHSCKHLHTLTESFDHFDGKLGNIYW